MKINVKRAQVVLRMVWESVQFAISSLKGDKFRTLLSLLGVTIGIFTIVLVLAVVGGLKGNIREGLSSLGGGTITVQREPWEVDSDQGWDWWELAQRPPVVVEEYQFVKRHLEGVEGVTFFTTFSADIAYKRNSFSDGNVVPVASDFDKIFTIGIAGGRWFLPTEADSRGRICFLGADIADDLFEGVDPIGKKVRIGGYDGYVTGVAKREGESIATIFDIDNSIFVPLGFGEIIGGAGGGGAIAIAPEDEFGQGVVMDEVRSLMRMHRGLRPEDGDNFAINRMSYLSGAVDEVFRTINLVGWIIGGFALLIGAFGIANILFVSVRERMPQIGIQKALGAKNYLILIQFLTESAVLSLVGGGLGILIVVIISLFLGGNSPVPFELTAVIVIEGVSIALVVGVLSGLVPAYSAAKMDPVKAINM